MPTSLPAESGDPQGRATIRWVPIERVRPYERNPRNCPQSAIDLVATSISANGFLSPIICDEQLIILAGHTRLLAARQLGLTAALCLLPAKRPRVRSLAAGRHLHLLRHHAGANRL